MIRLYQAAVLCLLVELFSSSCSNSSCLIIVCEQNVCPILIIFMMYILSSGVELVAVLFQITGTIPANDMPGHRTSSSRP